MAGIAVFQGVAVASETELARSFWKQDIAGFPQGDDANPVAPADTVILSWNDGFFISSRRKYSQRFHSIGG